ncbi:MAG TPA: hypothetical protein VIJ50_03805 [Solirubrobacteraceae bacterium]
MKHSRTHIWLPALTLIALALFTTGCGGSGKSSSSQANAVTTSSSAATGSASTTPGGEATGSAVSSAPTSVAFVAHANTVCAYLHRVLIDQKDSFRTPQDIAGIVPRRVAAEQAGIATLVKLTPPAALATAWQQILAARRQLLEDTAKLGQLARAKNAAAERQLFVTSNKTAREMELAATHNGFSACAQLGGT